MIKIKKRGLLLIAGIVPLAAGTNILRIGITSMRSIWGIGCSCLWSIKELFEQRERVRKGWFPENPKHKNDSNK